MTREHIADTAGLVAGPDFEDTDPLEPNTLTVAQLLGEACAVCHARWPRPRTPLDHLPDGTLTYGCDECAGIAASYRETAGRSGSRGRQDPERRCAPASMGGGERARYP